MFLNSEVQAALDAAKAKINEHTRQAANELAACNDALIAANHLWSERQSSIAKRRAEMDQEELESDAVLQRNLREVQTRIATIRLGMRDDEKKEEPADHAQQQDDEQSGKSGKVHALRGK
jgi:hypothetical protein